MSLPTVRVRLDKEGRRMVWVQYDDNGETRHVGFFTKDHNLVPVWCFMPLVEQSITHRSRSVHTITPQAITANELAAISAALHKMNGQNSAGEELDRAEYV